LLRAYEVFLGAEVLREAIIAHLTENAGKPTETAAFLEALGRVAPAEVVQSLRAHLERPGLPEVRVALRCDAGEAALTLSQSADPPHPVAACVRLDGERRCQILTERLVELDLE